MVFIDKTLKTVLETATGVDVYAARKPLKKSLPAVIYLRVSDTPQVSMSGTSGNKRTRFQITCLATSYGGLRNLVKDVETGLVVNTTDFSVALPLEGQEENKDENAKVYESIRDYFLWHQQD